MQKLLTDAFLRSLTTPPRGRIEYADLRCGGLAFRITSRGARSWSFRFRDPATGKVGRATIGDYPDVGLSAARGAANDMRRAVAKGSNPAAMKRQQRRDATSKSFEALAERYVAAIKNPASDRFKRSAERDEFNLEKHVLPKWRGRRYDSIARADVIELVDGLLAAGTPVLANRVQSLISTIYNFAIDADLIGVNPCTRLRKRGAERVGVRVLDDAELRLFWPGIIGPPVSPRTGQGLRLALLTGARIGEIAGLAREELAHVDDADRATWTIPADRYKTGKPHLVPLSPMARDIVLSLIKTLDDDGRFLFPARSVADQPMPGHSFTTAMRRFGEQLDVDTGGGDARKSWQAAPPSPHDLRRTLGTRLAELRVPKEIRDRVLGHTPADVGSKHYNVHDFADEKRETLNRWALALDAILTPRSAAAAQ
jgi:integrase